MKIYTSNGKWGHCCCKSRYFERIGDRWSIIGEDRLQELRSASKKAPRPRNGAPRQRDDSAARRRRESLLGAGLHVPTRRRPLDVEGVTRQGDPIALVDRSREDETYRPGSETRLQREARLRDAIARKRLGDLKSVERIERIMDRSVE